MDDTQEDKRDVVYARVSSHEQEAKGDLDRQAMRIIESQSGLQKPLILKEVGSGLNDKRKKLQELISLVLDGKVNKVYVTYRDRLTRFGYHYLESVFLAKNVEIVVLNDNLREKDVQQELVDLSFRKNQDVQKLKYHQKCR